MVHIEEKNALDDAFLLPIINLKIPFFSSKTFRHTNSLVFVWTKNKHSFLRIFWNVGKIKLSTYIFLRGDLYCRDGVRPHNFSSESCKLSIKRLIPTIRRTFATFNQSSYIWSMSHSRNMHDTFRDTMSVWVIYRRFHIYHIKKEHWAWSSTCFTSRLYSHLIW